MNNDQIFYNVILALLCDEGLISSQELSETAKMLEQEQADEDVA